MKKDVDEPFSDESNSDVEVVDETRLPTEENSSNIDEPSTSGDEVQKPKRHNYLKSMLPTVDLCQNTLEKSVKIASENALNFQISTTSFYSKSSSSKIDTEIQQTPKVTRKRRAAASTALRNIRKIEKEEMDTESETENPVPNNMKKHARKLWNPDQHQQAMNIDSPFEKVAKRNEYDDSLTPQNLKHQLHKGIDRFQQETRIFENLKQINETSKMANVTYSYRNFAAQKSNAMVSKAKKVS